MKNGTMIAIANRDFPLVLDKDGAEYVTLVEACKPFGLKPDTQRERLHQSGWATLLKIGSVRSSGKKAAFWSLPLRQLPMFFATLSPGHVRADARAVTSSAIASARWTTTPRTATTALTPRTRWTTTPRTATTALTPRTRRAMPANQRPPRVIFFRDDEVYAPWCWWCDSDASTKWDYLPELARLLYPGYAAAEGICFRCEHIIHADHAEAWRAREPERLAARLAELLVEAGRAA